MVWHDRDQPEVQSDVADITKAPEMLGSLYSAGHSATLRYDSGTGIVRGSLGHAPHDARHPLRIRSTSPPHPSPSSSATCIRRSRRPSRDRAALSETPPRRINVGGVALLKKHHDRVLALSDLADHHNAGFVLKRERRAMGTWGRGPGAAFRRWLALQAFEMTARYDEAISGYFCWQYADATDVGKHHGPPQRLALRYGANPH
jgi:phosphoribosylaminoimidazolecarboxamide formyltransferase/IMP cyclohydrolase